MWNATGTALLVLSYADFDATNQSYYGGSTVTCWQALAESMLWLEGWFLHWPGASNSCYCQHFIA